MYTTKHQVCILSFYMNYFQRFLSEYKQDFSLLLILYGIHVCYYFHSLWCHFSKGITATLWIISATKKVILTTEEVITTPLKIISAITLSVADTTLLVTKIPIVVAEITFKLAVVTSSVAKITFVVAEITFIVVVIISSVVKIPFVVV